MPVPAEYQRARDVSLALRRNVDEKALDLVLSKLPVGTVEFWNPDFTD